MTKGLTTRDKQCKCKMCLELLKSQAELLNQRLTFKAHIRNTSIKQVDVRTK